MKKLYKSNTNRRISGVCGGLGEYFGIDPSLMRIAWVLLSIFTAFSGVIVYIILALIIPREPFN